MDRPLTLQNHVAREKLRETHIGPSARGEPGNYNEQAHRLLTVSGEDLIEHQGEITGFVFETLAQLAEFAFDNPEPIGEVKAGENGCTGSVEIAGATGDSGHQLVDLLGQLLGIARVTGGRYRIGLIKDGKPDGLFAMVR
jgi:hypothetical protein